MLINSAITIFQGDTLIDSVYQGSNLVWNKNRENWIEYKAEDYDNFSTEGSIMFYKNNNKGYVLTNDNTAQEVAYFTNNWNIWINMINVTNPLLVIPYLDYEDVSLRNKSTNKYLYTHDFDRIYKSCEVDWCDDYARPWKVNKHTGYVWTPDNFVSYYLYWNWIEKKFFGWGNGGEQIKLLCKA